MQTPNILPKLLDVPQVAEYLGVSERFAYELFRMRELRGVRLGNRWRATETAVMEYIAKKEKENENGRMD